MNITDADIQAKFPFSQFRPDQLEAVRLTLDQFDKGKKFVIIEMPVGGGKSAIAYSVAQFFANSYYLTIQRFLQDQLMGDFGQPPRDGLLPMVDLKGRGNYQCTHAQRNAFALVRGLLSSLGHPDTIAKQVAEYFVKNRNFEGLSIKLDFDAVSKIVEMVESKTGCDKGVCRTRDGKSRCKDCFPNGLPAHCPYWARNAQAQAARICLMNFRVFLHQTVLTNAFGHRNLMIVDECHQMESELMNFIGFSLNDKSLREYGIVLSEMGSAAEYARFLKDKDILAVIENILKMARAAGDLEKEDEWMDIQRRCGHFLATAEDGNWVALFKDTDQKKKYKVVWNTVELKPVYVRKMAHDFVFNRADKVLMMSATVLSAKTVCSSLGIETNDMYAIRYGSRFPVENRPIFFTPVGSLSYKNKAETLPKIVPAVDKIVNKYKGKKGIIHTHNFEIARLLISECETRDRMLFQEDFENKKEMLKEHAEREDSVIVAPAMHEGLDLKDELSRFQILVKMPYPPIKGNPQLEARMQDSQEYYDWLTALKLVQATGRSVRSETDWAHTYILDADFEWFFRKARGILPKWFREAIVDQT